MKRTAQLFLTILLATIVVWIAFWKFSGQDLNLFARNVLPIPIAGTVLITGLLSGTLAGIYRIIKGQWMRSFSRMTWIIWSVLTTGILLLLVTTNG